MYNIINELWLKVTPSISLIFLIIAFYTIKKLQEKYKVIDPAIFLNFIILSQVLIWLTGVEIGKFDLVYSLPIIGVAACVALIVAVNIYVVLALIKCWNQCHNFIEAAKLGKKTISREIGNVEKAIEYIFGLLFNVAILLIFLPLLITILPWIFFHYDEKIGGKPINWIWWVESLILIIIGAVIYNLKPFVPGNYVLVWWVIFITFHLTLYIEFIIEFTKGWLKTVQKPTSGS